MILNPIIILAGALVCAGLGAAATWWRMRGCARRAERKAIREMESLHRARAVADLRDSTSARIPHFR